MTYTNHLYDSDGHELARVSYALAYDDEAGSALTVLRVTPEGYEVTQDDEEVLRERAGYDDALEAERDSEITEAWETE
jgi:hypothetical protein